MTQRNFPNFWATQFFISLLTALFLTLAGFAGVAPENAAASEFGTQAFQDNPKDGLRNCFLSFQEDMVSFEKGNLKSASAVFKLLQPPERISSEGNFTYLLHKAKQLFLVIQSLIFDYETDIPDAPVDADVAEVHLSSEDSETITFHMVRMKDGTWAFGTKTLESPQIKARYERLREQLKKLTHADMDGDTFNVELMSPYRTMLRLRNGVMGRFGLDLDDAAQSLDLSRKAPILRENLGRTLAVRLYRILHFLSPLDLEKLSSNPNTENLPVFLVFPEYGAISMHVVTDKNGVKSWRFTPGSLAVLHKAYDASIAAVIKEGNDPFIGVDLPMDVRLDDFVQRHMGYLQKELFGMDLWKYVVLVLLGVSSPLIVRWIERTVRSILSLLRNRSSEIFDAISESRVHLPLTVMLMVALWTKVLLLLITTEGDVAFLLVVAHVVMALTVVWFFVVLTGLLAKLMAARMTSKAHGTATLVAAQVLKIAILLYGLFELTEAFGIDSTKVLTALGIGGVAIALAGKNTVENIFGTVMIVGTRPFSIGDYIIVNSIHGIVEHVGLRSTIIRTFYNSLITVPNSHFITSPVDNMGKRQYRRFKTSIRLAYDTPPDKIVAYIEALRELVRETPVVDATRQYLRTYDFGPDSIDILIDLHLQVEGRDEELELRERFILDAKQLAEMLEVEFALPTRTLHMREEQAPEHTSFESEAKAAALGREAVSMLFRTRKEQHSE
jgi:MscS family membrane protein